MKAIVLLLCLLLISCPASSFEMEKIETMSPFKMPQLEDVVLLENRRITLSFSREVRIRNMSLDEKKVEFPSNKARMFTIRLPETLGFGEGKRLRFTLEDGLSGNLSRMSIPLMGINQNQAKVLLTEISVKGTKSSPDRIELTVIEKGTTGSLTITDGTLEERSLLYTLPDIAVDKGDVIVIFLSSPHEGEDIIRIGNRRIFNIDAPECSLLSTNGAVILFSHTNGKGKIMDAFIYRKSDTVSSGGWGNEKTRLSYEELNRRGEWRGDAFPSDGNTSTRVFARFYPYTDGNTERDWYLTATRGATFGYSNDNNAYQRPEEEEKE